MRSLTSVLDGMFFDLPLYARIIIIAVFLALAAVFSYKKRFLTISGVITSIVLGFIVFYIGGVSGVAVFLFFFVSASMLSRLSDGMNTVAEKTGRRDMMQVIANGVPAALMLVLYGITHNPVFIGAFAAAIAEAEADTAASSIGMLSSRPPISIITFTPVPPGLSGGVSAIGTLSALAFSALIAILDMGTFGCSFQELLAIAASGFIGALFDSFLGATVQVNYRKEDGSLTEKSMENGRKLERARGIPFIDNDMVNLLSGLFSTAVFLSAMVIMR